MAQLYVYNLREAYAALGRAVYEQMLDRAQNPPHVDPVESHVPNIPKGVICKDLDVVSKTSSVQSISLDYNTGLCKPCRRLCAGTGYRGPNPSKSLNKGTYYLHWNGRYLEKSASRGCPLCLVVHRAHRRTRAELHCGEELSGLYDFGKYVGDFEIQALRFYYYCLLETGEPGILLQLPYATVTLQPTESLELRIDSFKPNDSTGSKRSLEQVIDWLKLCDTTHPTCASLARSRTAFLPSRLILVGAAPGFDSVRLVDSKNIDPKSSYMTLSHRWGAVTADRMVTTQQSISQFKERIPLEALPKTFANAIEVTRALGIEYLWIDSLCIIQDSRDDWLEQAAMMWLVYTNSHLNISATASENSHGGLFRNRHPQTTKVCMVSIADGHPQLEKNEYACYTEDEWRNEVDHGPVNRRAWVCQERLLSPRVVHFSEDQIFWECHELKSLETYPEGLPPRYDFDVQRRIFRSELASDDPRKLLEVWHSIIAMYTKTNLTYPSDKLIAVSGLARQVSDSSPIAGKYLAGLWKPHLIGQLLWSASPHSQRAMEYRAPSWSWACLDGPVHPNFDWSGYAPGGQKYRSRPMVTVIDAHVTPMDDEYGSAKDGILRVSGLLLKVGLTLTRPQSRSKAPEHAMDQTPREKFQDTIKRLDLLNRDEKEYTGEHLKTMAVSWRGGSGLHLMGMDPERGLIINEELAPLPKYGAVTKREFQMSFSSHEAKVNLDEDFNLNTMPAMDLFFMPALCTSKPDRPYDRENYDIESIGGLLLSPTDASIGQYRRVGVGELDDYAAVEFFCALGNQEREEVPSEGVWPDLWELDEFVPERWYAKSLSFVPKNFARYQITVV